MKKVLLSAIAAAFLGAIASPVLAQGTPPAGPQDCKPTEQWDPATKACKPKS